MAYKFISASETEELADIGLRILRNSNEKNKFLVLFVWEVGTLVDCWKDKGGP